MGNTRGEKKKMCIITDVSNGQNLIRQTYKHVFSLSYYFYIDLISQQIKLIGFNIME